MASRKLYWLIKPTILFLSVWIQYLTLMLTTDAHNRWCRPLCPPRGSARVFAAEGQVADWG